MAHAEIQAAYRPNTGRLGEPTHPEPPMPYAIDETHDPELTSWVESANDPETDFPIQNLPLCIVHPTTLGWADDVNSLAIAIGDEYLLLDQASKCGEFDDMFVGITEELAIRASHLSYHLQASVDFRREVRRRVSRLLRSDVATLRDDAELRKLALIPRADARIEMTHDPRDYTDFYASVYHATNVGSMFRPDNPLLPNYKWIPVGYHGRASSIVRSGTDIIRPTGQQAPTEEGGPPAFAPCRMLDYELEMGVVIGRGNDLGQPIAMANAEDHVLGLCLLNDWSARDIQKWEYQPLGPFLAKSFASTVSPYIVTMEALAPFRTPAMERPADDPQPLPHLDSIANRKAGGFDITLEVFLASQQMRDRGLSPVRLSRGNFKDMYWTVAQMIAHHTSNGCNLAPGDLLGSGTISGPRRDSRGCLLELTWDGDPWANPPIKAPGTQRTPIELPTSETRTFLEDGDEVIIKGFCERDGFRRIGFGTCRGIIRPARR